MEKPSLLCSLSFINKLLIKRLTDIWCDDGELWRVGEGVCEAGDVEGKLFQLLHDLSRAPLRLLYHLPVHLVLWLKQLAYTLNNILLTKKKIYTQK